MKEITLKEIHEIEMEIVKDVDRVCKENNLKYTIIGGTLIGAVRHKGFIPWDDDIDIAMPREDYKRFIKIYSMQKNEQFSIFEHSINKQYYYPFIKISDNRTTLIEKNYVPIEGLGISLDIFPIDNVNSKFLEKKLNKIVFYRKGLSKCFSNQDIVSKNFCKKILKKFIFFRDIEFYITETEKLAQKDNYNKSCDLAGVLVNGTGKKDLFPIELFNEYTTIPFENISLMTIKNYEKFLKHRFGDYMQLPPKEQQIAHLNEIYWK